MLNFAAATLTPLDRLRRTEFARLDEAGVAYADYTGAALYGESQLRAHFELLSRGVFGNPHSEHEPSRLSTTAIEAARDRVLSFFGVERSTHEVCFTANTSAAIKLVAESYPFSARAGLVLAADNHNSMNGIREYARRANAPVRVIPLDAELRMIGAEGSLDGGAGLLAFPAQSNFSGVMHPLSLVTRAKSCGYDVLVDAAAFASSHPLDLRCCPADFVALSFYKLFGYPTGVGALVARREALEKLGRPWFAGGTVLFASVRADTHRLRPGHEGFEDGTPDFLSIAALPSGFDLLEAAGMDRIESHVEALTADLLERLTALRHTNGTAAVRIYGPSTTTARGATVAFNVCDRSGGVVPYGEVEERARHFRLALRGGCFCNPGASETAFGLSEERLRNCFELLGDGFTPARLSSCSGTPAGAVRASFGLASNSGDVDRVIELVATYREG